jgi:hypothetical protein
MIAKRHFKHCRATSFAAGVALLASGWVSVAVAQGVESFPLPQIEVDPQFQQQQPFDQPQGFPQGAPEDEVVQPQEARPAERVVNPVAEFTGVDKITGRIITFDVYIDETVQFGALQVTPRVCYSAPETEEPKTDSFVEVDEITLDRKIRRIFTGWMFAESPGLNAVEHAVYDVWLKTCKQQSDVPPPEAAATN